MTNLEFLMMFQMFLYFSPFLLSKTSVYQVLLKYVESYVSEFITVILFQYFFAKPMTTLNKDCTSCNLSKAVGLLKHHGVISLCSFLFFWSLSHPNSDQFNFDPVYYLSFWSCFIWIDSSSWIMPSKRKVNFM